MRKTLLTSMSLAMALAGCAGVRDSNFNPLNWFGSSTSQRVVSAPQETEVNPLIPKRRSFFDRPPEPPYPGALVHEVSELNVRRRPGGAVVEATGIFSAAGSYDVRLVEIETADPARLTYELRAIQPSAGKSFGTDHARTVTAAINLTDQDLLDIRSVRVIAQSNTRTARR